MHWGSARFEFRQGRHLIRDFSVFFFSRPVEMPSWYLKSGHDRFLAHLFHLTTHRLHCVLWATDILHAVHRMANYFINWAIHFFFRFFPASSYIQCVYSFDIVNTATITGFPGERAFCAVNVRCSGSQQRRDLRTALIWVVTQRVAVISYRRFGTSYQSHLKGILDPPEMGPIGCPETSVRIYRHSLHNNPEERISHLLGGGSLDHSQESPVYAAQFVGA
jgi:hypothetical protein